MNIIFDVDETLYDMTQPFQRAFDELWKNKYKVDIPELYRLSRLHSDEVFDKVMAGVMNVDEAGIYRMTHAMCDLGFSITEEEAVAFQKAYRKYQQRIDISDTMNEILNYLQEQQVTIGILTNGVTEHQWEKIEGMNLSKWFLAEHVFVSEAIGYSKPDKRAFEIVEENMKLDAEQSWYIGDSPEYDVTGAKGAGWHMILLNRRHKDAAGLPEVPDYIVENEEELLLLLKKIVPENR